MSSEDSSISPSQPNDVEAAQGFSETEAQSGRGIDVVALEKAEGQSAIHLREHCPDINVPLCRKAPIDRDGDCVESPGALRMLAAGFDYIGAPEERRRQRRELSEIP